jgi:thiamine-monophosphate kinase
MAGNRIAPELRGRLDRPVPRIGAGQRLSALAHACIDLSDGLMADLGHLCRLSGVGAEIGLDQLPASAWLAAVETERRRPWQACGGDDYELCFTAAPRNRDLIVQAMDFAGIAATRIGRIVAGQGVHALDAHGARWQPARTGYQHFG